MASDRKFHTSVNNTDIIQQSEDGGGIKLTTNGKFIFGAKHQNVIDQLTDENYNGTVDVNANNQSFIAVMNEDSHAIEVEVPINHFTSLEIPTDNVVTSTQTQPNEQNNKGCDYIEYPPYTWIDPSGKVNIVKRPSGEISSFTTFINHENDYKKLGWGNYGVSSAKLFWNDTYPNYTYSDGTKTPNEPNLKEKIKDPSNLTFDEALYNFLKLVTDFSNSINDKTKYDKLSTDTNDDEIRYVKIYNYDTFQYNNPEKIYIGTDAILYALPLSLKIMMARGIYNSGWITTVSRLLVTTRKLAKAKDPQTKLGITEEESTNGGKDPLTKTKLNSLSDVQKLNKYAKQIDDILALYNNDKTNFLKALKDEFDRFYNKLVDQRKEPNSISFQQRFKDNESEFRKFYNEYNQKALDGALNVIDCPNSPILMPRSYAPPKTTTKTTTKTTPTQAPTPTPEETQEDIYEANFLPLIENDYISIGYSLDCSAANSAAINDVISGREGETFSASDLGSDIKITPTELTEIDTYIVFAKTVGQKDYKNGVINPNTLLDIASICKSLGIRALISCAREGHRCKTTSGRVSRHMIGTGLDIGGFLYIDNTKPIKNQNNWITKGTKVVRTAIAVPPAFKKICDEFVAAALTLPGAKRDAEGGAQRGVLWYFNAASKGGNHFDHVHYSNKELYAGWKPKCVPKLFDCTSDDCAALAGSNAPCC